VVKGITNQKEFSVDYWREQFSGDFPSIRELSHIVALLSHGQGLSRHNLPDKRTMDVAKAFMSDLRTRVPNRFQLSTDALLLYRGTFGAVQHAFGNEIDYGTERKIFKAQNRTFQAGYFPVKLTGIEKRRYIGNPHMELITTCHCERTNLSVRTFTRRFTRCTLGYSKKLENLRHAVALFIAHFNLCRVHSAHDKTPAHAANLTDHTWTIEEMLKAAN
jgi:hypothetical protein